MLIRKKHRNSNNIEASGSMAGAMLCSPSIESCISFPLGIPPSRNPEMQVSARFSSVLRGTDQRRGERFDERREGEHQR